MCNWFTEQSESYFTYKFIWQLKYSGFSASLTMVSSHGVEFSNFCYETPGLGLLSLGIAFP